MKSYKHNEESPLQTGAEKQVNQIDSTHVSAGVCLTNKKIPINVESDRTKTHHTTPSGDVKKDDDTAVTVPPAEDNPSRETESLDYSQVSIRDGKVTPISVDDIDATGSSAKAFDVEAITAPSIRDQILSARKKPEEVAGLLATQSEQMSVPVYKRPPDSSFWRVRVEDDWEATKSEVLLLPRKDGGGPEFLLVAPALEPLFNDDPRLRNLVRYFHLAFVADARGHVGWWAVPSRSDNDWHVSARAAMHSLKTGWGMMKSDQGAKGYKLEKPMSDLGEPAWPTGTYDDWFVKGFSDKLLNSETHPVLMDLQGRR